MKVVELVTSVKAYGWSPEELHDNYPHVSMSKIYSALAYYWDHKEELDADMERRYQYVEKPRRRSRVARHEAISPRSRRISSCEKTTGKEVSIEN